MPKYFEFVFAAYGIWVGVIAAYLLYLFGKSRSVRRALDRLGASGPR
jgi:hypothetical protein